MPDSKLTVQVPLWLWVATPFLLAGLISRPLSLNLDMNPLDTFLLFVVAPLYSTGDINSLEP